MSRTTVARRSKTEARQMLRTGIDQAVEAFRAVPEGDLEARYEAAQRVVALASSADFVTPSGVDLAKAYLDVNKDRYAALQLDRAWVSLPARLAKGAAGLIERIQKDVQTLDVALTDSDIHPTAVARSLSRLDSSFDDAAQLGVYRSVIATARGIDEHHADVTTRERFDLLWKEVRHVALRLGCSQRHCSTSVLSNLTDECERRAWFDFLSKAAYSESDWGTF